MENKTIPVNSKQRLSLSDISEGDVLDFGEAKEVVHRGN